MAAFDRALRDAVAREGAPTSALWACLETLPSADAERALPTLLTLAARFIDGAGEPGEPGEPSPALPDGWDEAAVRRFVVHFVRQSAFVDRLVDASLLTPCARRLKWKAEGRARVDARAEQRRRQRAQARTSRGNLRCVARNARAFDAIESAARAGEAPPHAVLRMTLEELRMQPPAFWASVRLDGTDVPVVRAVLHKTKLYRERYGGAAMPEAARLRLDDRFGALASEDARDKEGDKEDDEGGAGNGRKGASKGVDARPGDDAKPAERGGCAGWWQRARSAFRGTQPPKLEPAFGAGG